ncbi:putative L-ascorbate peroxidase 6 [Amylocarpus encephaloides]|uniref:Peroxidase n=1 Tax=Amylocarpus encephaloides TaxID=45428 RepID=A0A9P7YNH9_9HELO|nr:putative L-ascorbate peroxidase 6 [Amylocarpus encephaloides]
MILPLFIALLTQIQGICGQSVDKNGVTILEKIEEVERQMLNVFTLVSVVAPCNKISAPENPHSGQQTSAEWVRIVFHDTITKNIEGPGLGGLDASVGFEADRPENVGAFINVTLGQFTQFSSIFLSMSDLIGIGLSDSLATCDQPLARRIPLRVGRMDATGPGPAGVPGPTDSLAFAQAAFTKAGFTNSEMIQAVACGHSLGGVHHENFPDIVPDPNDPENLFGRSPFDSTPDVFDNTGVQEYLTRTGLKGGPLVVGPEATRTDFLIFNSDDNATITAMSTPSSFENTCLTIFQKMMDNVPAGTVLSDPVTVRPWILRESHLDLLASGGVTFSGTISGHSTPAPPATANYFYGTVGGGNTGQKTVQQSFVYPNRPNGGDPEDTLIGFGTIVDYEFNDTLSSPSITSINIMSSYTAPVNLNIFILPSQSFSNPVNGQRQSIIRVAVLGTLATTGTTMSLRIWSPNRQPGSVVPTFVNQNITMSFLRTQGDYKIYQAVALTGDGAPGSTTVQANLGTTQASVKVQTGSLKPCTSAIPTTC